jgi:hypothetical protein
MTITFENDNDIIVYPSERILSYASDNQYIFLVQSIWWISSIIGLQQGLILHIDNLRNRSDNTTRRVSWEPHDIQHQSWEQARDSVVAGTNTIEPEPDQRDRILRECKEYLCDSRRLRDIANLKATGKSKSARINPLRSTKRAWLNKKKQPLKDYTKTEGIQEAEITRRKSAGVSAVRLALR